MSSFKKTTSLLILASLLLGFTGSATADLQCETGTLSGKNSGETCRVSSAVPIQDITGESITAAKDVSVIVESGGRIYTDHKTESNNPTAAITLSNGEFVVKSGGVVHANINVSAFNIFIREGGIVDATGLGYQTVPGKSGDSGSCPSGRIADSKDYCLAKGPAGGGGGGTNSGTGTGGGGHAGKGGTFDNDDSSYKSSGGGRGTVNDQTYGTLEDPSTFGSAGGSGGGQPTKGFFLNAETRDGKVAAYQIDTKKDNVGNAFQSSYSGDKFQAAREILKNASDGFKVNGELGRRDDPSHDLADSDRWHPNNDQYRVDNPNDITMGAGGGIIRLVASNKLNNSGYILSRGLDGSGIANNAYPGSGGAGGSISISSGGVFGDGKIWARGGDYAEFIDGGESNQGSQGVAAGGGGGYIFYEFSIADQNWDLSAEGGQGTVNIGTIDSNGKDFSGNQPKQDSASRDLVATGGEITSKIAFAAFVNETIVNPGETIKVNGTASSTVTVNTTTPSGEQQILDETIEPGADRGFYSANVSVLDISSDQDLGNYTLSVSSTISGNTITEQFQVSHRKIQINQGSEYILKPGESFKVEGTLHRIDEDGSGGVNVTDYSGKVIDFGYFSGSDPINTINPTTDSNGRFSYSDSVPATKGRKYYRAKDKNQNGITGFDRKNLSWMQVNDTIVDPGQFIQINGTAHNTVNFEIEKPDGTFLDKGSVNPNPNGYFEVDKQSLTRSIIDSENDLGNYTLRVQTKLNGEVRTETFEISHREIEIDNSPDFLLKSGENLEFSNSAHLIKQDGTGGSERVDYTGELITFNYFDQLTRENSTDISTNTNGRYSVFQDVKPTPGLKRFTLETRNDNGITDTVRDNDLENINNRTIAWTGIDDYIVNSGEKIKVNGSAHNAVELIFNGTIVNSSVSPDSNGFFSSKFSVPEIQDLENFGNYTLGVNTSLNRKELTEEFEVSIRGIRFNLTKDYPINVDPNENFTVSGQAVKYVSNGSEGSRPENYTNEQIKIVYRDDFGKIQTKTTITNSSGGFRISDFESPLNAGDRNIEISTVNTEGIRQNRVEAVRTRVRVKNSSTISPSKRLFKDFRLKETRFVNPGQDVRFSVDTRKSLEFVKEVYANVTLPDRSVKRVNLTAQDTLGKRFDSAKEWDSSNTTHLSHTSRTELDNNTLRIGYNQKEADNLISSYPMELTSGKVRDVSDKDNDASVVGSVNRDSRGVFSTSATEFQGGKLRIENQSALNLATNFTVGAWVKTNDKGTIYSRSSTDGTEINPEIRITENGKALMEVSNGDVSTRVKSSITVNDGSWYQITGVYNKSHISIYVDGNLENSSQVISQVERFPEEPEIGGSGVFEDRRFNGKIDNLRIFNKSLNGERINLLASRNGTIVTDRVKFDQEVKDIIKLTRFSGSLNNQSLRVKALSDPDNDSDFEQSSDTIRLDQGTDIDSIEGLSNSSKKFKLEINLATDNASESPIFDSVGFKARKNPRITWKNSKQVNKFFESQFGAYNVDYFATDFSDNKQDTQLEESTFTVRNIEIEAEHPEVKAPGSNLGITGNVSIVKGDGNGGKSTSAFTGQISAILNDTIRGDNSIPESLLLESVESGEARTVPVNGTETPLDTSITFIGRFSGTDESLEWNNYTDWDSFQTRSGTSHSNKEDSKASNSSVTLGYPSKDITGGSSLETYLAMDDRTLPLSDSIGRQDYNAVGGLKVGTKGILSTKAVNFNGSNGFRAQSPFTQSGSFTINAWIKPDRIPSSNGHLGSGPGNPFTIFALKDTLTFQVTKGGDVYGEVKANGDSVSTTTFDGNIQAGEWNMVTMRYNGQEDLLAVSTGDGGDTSRTALSQIPDLTSAESYIGYRPDIDGNGFEGSIDELRFYSNSKVPFNLRILAGDIPSQQQRITTSQKSFSEQVKAESLVLEADTDLEGQDARVTVRNNAGGLSDPVSLRDGRNRYPIKGLTADSQNFSLTLELDSNVTDAPTVKSLDLVRRFATEDPQVDIDSDGQPEASFSGKILGGQKEVVPLENLSTGLNTAQFSTRNGILDARINYTEVLRQENLDPVQVDGSGDFDTSFSLPERSGSYQIQYFVANENGIRGIQTTEVSAGLTFENQSVEDITDGDKIIDPEGRFQVNASIGASENPVERVWAIITSPDGREYERDLTQYNNWRLNQSVNSIFDQEGTYSIRLNARDTEGLREISSPQLNFNVTNGTITSKPVDPIIGLERKFTITGEVRQNLSNQLVNASVNVRLDSGNSKAVETNQNGSYSATLISPSSTGNYTVKVSGVDENTITSSNTTTIKVESGTNLDVSVPDVVAASRVGTEVGQNKTFDVEIVNTGNTDARNVKIFTTGLPVEGDGKWRSINKTYNISSGSNRNVTAEVQIQADSEFGTYSGMNLEAKYTSSGGVTQNISKPYDIEVKPNTKPLWQSDRDLKFENGFSGNLLNSSTAIELLNEGTSKANEVSWTLTESRIKSWTEIFRPRQDPSKRRAKSDLNSGQSLELTNMTVDIPAGTAPGNYSTLIQSTSAQPTQTNSANLTVEVPNDPKFKLELEPAKSDVKIPEGEINMSNPIQAGSLPTGTTAGEILRITLNNTGNRDLDWEIGREQRNERRIFFDEDDEGTVEVGTERRESNVSLLNQQNYTYSVPNREVPVLFSVDSNAGSGVYKANVTITCQYPIGGSKVCESPRLNDQDRIVLPLNGSVKDPKPEVTDLSVEPNTTGVGDRTTISASVTDNKQTFIDNQDPVNATIKKNLDDNPIEIERTDISVGFGGVVSFGFTPTREFDQGTADNQEPDRYCVQLTARDSSGKTTQSNCKDFTVQESASPRIKGEPDVVSLDNVTADRGDSTFVTGDIVGGNVTASNLTISFSTDSPSRFTFSESNIDLGDVKAGERKDFNVTLNSVENLNALRSFTVFITSEWTDPDGESRAPDFETETESIDIDVAPNKRIEARHGESNTLTVPHNTTGTEQFILESAGNRRLTNVQLECVQCGERVFISGYNRSGFDMAPGEETVIGYNITVEEFTRPIQAARRDIRITSDDESSRLNQTIVQVPEDRSISTDPDSINTIVPKGQGDVNISSISVSNTGNTDLSLEFRSNDTGPNIFFGPSKLVTHTISLAAGRQKSVEVRSDTSSIGLGEKFYKLEPSLTSGSLDTGDPINLSMLVQDVSLEATQTQREIISGERLTAKLNLTKEGSPIEAGNNVDYKLQASGQTFDVSEEFLPNSSTWNVSFNAPVIEDGVNHSYTYTATSNVFESVITDSIEVEYTDITPPEFANVSAEPVEQGENSTIKVILKDKSDIQGDVSANILKPNGDTEQIQLNPQTGSGLSSLSQKTWKGEFSETSQQGLYNMTVVATDVLSNRGTSSGELFRSFQPLKINGSAGEPSETTEIQLIDSNKVSEKIEPENGSYDQRVKSGEYSEAVFDIDNTKSALIAPGEGKVRAQRVVENPPKIDASIKEQEIGLPPNQIYLKGFGVVSESFENITGRAAFDLSDVTQQINSFGNVIIMKCDQYNVSKRVPCQSEYETIETGFDSESGSLVAPEISGFSSYIAVEDRRPEQEVDVNFNATGNLGNLSQIQNLGDLDGALSEVANNTEGLSSIEDSGGSGGGESGGSTQEGFEDLASQLNDSEEETQELAIGNSKISISIRPREQKTTAISLQNPKPEQVDIQLSATENIRDLVSFDKNISLDSGEFETVRITVDTSNTTELKEFSGFIRVQGQQRQRSIPVNIEVVEAENRLLDVSVEPTIDSFKPGESARLKLSFSNQGFSRDVDATTTVEIANVVTDEVIAKKTETYAVQTTLDKVVNLKIPEDTELGTYEARALVEYSNVPGNRSATAVSQVSVQKPFLERETLFVTNQSWIIVMFLLVTGGSGGGYWYYRKKKLEAKRSRFEEQVDNDALPSETGRSAFVGHLSEIGTRAFLNLDDLMTHCLTAGATGAGKSVASQVIVEEALEQGTNVIVLDPTGQWSGYLDENDDDEFFAFYNDFGMKEGDARSYKGNIRAIDAGQDTIDITDKLRAEGDEGSIIVFSMHKLDHKELEDFLADTIEQVFDFNPEEKDSLQTLLVYDEAHRVLEKYGGTGRGASLIEMAAREFRKFGIGMLLISQVIEDFPEEARANIGTKILMRTEYENDLDRIERKYGDNITKGISKADTGTGMIQNSSYNHGRPYFVDFRPVKHSPERLSDEELENFEKYNRRVDEIEDMISILEDQDEDVFEYKSQLKLVKKNIRKRSFNLVETYLDELEDDLDKEM